MADAPRDPAQYAEFLQKNPQLLSPQEQALTAHVAGANQPGGHADPAAPAGHAAEPGAPGTAAPATPSASAPGVGASDSHAQEAPHLAHPLYTPAEAHEVAREKVEEHQHGHTLERGGR
jgi:hypothetical protein